MTRPSESEKRQKLLKAMFAGIGDGCYTEPSFHANFGEHVREYYFKDRKIPDEL